MIKKTNILEIIYPSKCGICGADVIIAVPIHKNRYRERGYNQISLILKNMYDNRILEKNLVKIVDNKRQSTLNLEERKINIKKSYKITDVDVIQGKRVLIVDDIYTTGNTLNECSRILKENGAELVGILAIAKD